MQRVDRPSGGALVLLVLSLWAAAAEAQQSGPQVAALDGVGVQEQLGVQLPLDAELSDERDRQVSLGQFFDGKRPVLLTLNYADCPMLCQLQLQGLVDVLREMTWEPGEQFSVVTISIDPTETAARAALAKHKHVQAYGRPGSARGWHFLRGDGETIRRVAEAVGFAYKYVPERREYAHVAVLMVCTPAGIVSRYLYGVEFSAATLRLSLVEAGEGRVGSTLDRVLLFCFHYDAATGRYGPAARRLMRFGALITVAVVVSGLAPYWLRRQRSRVPAAVQDPPRAGNSVPASDEVRGWEAPVPESRGSGGGRP